MREPGTNNNNDEVRLSGLAVSGGVARGRVCRFNDRRHVPVTLRRIEQDGVAGEVERLRQAVQVATDRLERLVKDVAGRVGQAEAQIFLAQKMILNDATVLNEMVDAIEQRRLSAESAVVRTLDKYESRLLEMDDEYIKERATDIGEVRRRLLDVLGKSDPAFQCGEHAHCQRGRQRVVVAEELTPGLTIELDTRQTLGFVTERGGPNSHAAILARSLGIPAVSGIRGIHGLLSCGADVLIDGDAGEVVVWPSHETLEGYQPARQDGAAQARIVAPVEGLTVLANISRAADVVDAVYMEAEGIGLYRTEFEFLAAGRLLGENEQYQHYASVLDAMAGKPVYFRMLDIGGDKEAAFFDLPKEVNPQLGFRGSRLLLGRPDLLRAQARALARASRHGTVYAMYPMIVEVGQFLQLRQMFEQAVADLPAADIRHGVMFEVPAACLQARELTREADFASIGSNDLLQYMYAVDRNNELVAYDYDPDRPAFWAAMRAIADAARQADCPLSICGELAGIAEYLPKLRDIGITTLSVSPRLVPALRLAGQAETSRS